MLDLKKYIFDSMVIDSKMILTADDLECIRRSSPIAKTLVDHINSIFGSVEIKMHDKFININGKLMLRVDTSGYIRYPVNLGPVKYLKFKKCNKIYNIWMASSSKDIKPVLIDTVEAETFKEACVRCFSSKNFKGSINLEELTYHGYKLFPDPESAYESQRVS